MKLVNDMKMLGGAFVKYWLGKADPGTPLGKNGFLEMFDLGLFFFFSFLVRSKILGSSLLLFKEPGWRGSDRSIFFNVSHLCFVVFSVCLPLLLLNLLLHIFLVLL